MAPLNLLQLPPSDRGFAVIPFEWIFLNKYCYEYMYIYIYLLVFMGCCVAMCLYSLFNICRPWRQNAAQYQERVIMVCGLDTSAAAWDWSSKMYIQTYIYEMGVGRWSPQQLTAPWWCAQLSYRCGTLVDIKRHIWHMCVIIYILHVNSGWKNVHILNDIRLWIIVFTPIIFTWLIYLLQKLFWYIYYNAK